MTFLIKFPKNTYEDLLIDSRVLRSRGRAILQRVQDPRTKGEHMCLAESGQSAYVHDQHHGKQSDEGKDVEHAARAERQRRSVDFIRHGTNGEVATGLEHTG